jgi:hypothetical protein
MSKGLTSYNKKNEKLKMKKRIEAAISVIKKMFPRTIQAVALECFLLKHFALKVQRFVLRVTESSSFFLFENEI